MKDKERLTAMVCTSAVGCKVDIALVGKHKKPHCFPRHFTLPVPYTNQANAWFDVAVMNWWLRSVFSPHCAYHHPGQKCLLLVDNFSAHKREDVMMSPLVIQRTSSNNKYLEYTGIQQIANFE